MKPRFEVHSDLCLTSGSNEVQVRASGRNVEVSAPSSRVLRSLPGGARPLSSLRRASEVLAPLDLALSIRVGDRIVAQVDPAVSSGLMARATRIPGLKLHLWSWMRSP